MEQNNCEPAVDRAWARKWTLQLLHSECSKEFEAICKLPPLKDNKELIEAYQLELGNIVLRHRNRFSKPDNFHMSSKLLHRPTQRQQVFKSLLTISCNWRIRTR
jgi:hypothetical protein